LTKAEIARRKDVAILQRRITQLEKAAAGSTKKTAAKAKKVVKTSAAKAKKVIKTTATKAKKVTRRK
jgi:hypothetical protein